MDINYYRAFRESLTEYEPVNFDDLQPYTETSSFKELMQQLGSVVELLNNSSTLWNTRLQGIIWIQSCLISADILRMPQIYLFLNRVVDALITQLHDLRSVITKEVCKTISLMAEILQAEFDPHAPIYLSGTCLFKLMESGNHVVAEHAHLAVLSILYNSSSVKLLKIILKQALDKHIYTRINCAEYILLILMNTLNAKFNPVRQGTSPPAEAPGVLDRHARDLIKYVQTIIGDSNAEARKRGRMLLIVFENLYSEIAQSAIRRFDQSN